MWPRLSIVAGLVAGVAVAGLLIGGLLFVGPRPAFTPSPTPPAVVSASPSADPSTDPSLAPTPTASASGSAGPSSTALFHIGEQAPPLVVPRVGGGTIDLAKLRGKPVWVTFMGTDSPPSRDEFPLMTDFAARYAANGLVVLAIDVGDDEGTVASFANELGATFPLGLDGDGSAAATWGASALPAHFWIDGEGIIRDGALGGIGADRMAAGAGSILRGVEVTPPEVEVTPAGVEVTP
jgi:peroxiredoxin